MVLKRAIKLALSLSAFAIVALTAYHYYVDEKTPTTSAFQAFEEYNAGVQKLAGVFTPLAKAALSRGE